MAHQIGKLSAVAVSKKKAPGLYGDGDGLSLQIAKGGSKSWIYRFMLNGKARSMGLGSANTYSLSEAREMASECRKLTSAGIDPIEERGKGRALAALEAAKAITFQDAAEKYLEIHKIGWRSPKHAEQWSATLKTYAYPLIGFVSVQTIDVALVMRIIEPIWATKTETASRVRGRIENVLDWATAHGYRTGDNPARWRGHMDKMLPERTKVRKVQHYPALPYTEIGEFMAELKKQGGTASKALEFLILTVCRTNEAVKSVPGEFNLEDNVWTIPGDRMKAGRDHRIPLSAPAKAIVEEFETADTYIFPGRKRGKPLSNNALLALLKRMGRSDITVHGFRSTFRDWAAEQTNYAREVAEMALAHAIEDKTEAAYRRGDLFEKRQRLMDDWAKYCAKPKVSGKVVPIRKNK
jgi:integrase